MSGGLDLRRARVVLRERSLADVLDLALRFVTVEARAYARVGLVTWLPLTVLALGAGWVVGWVWAWAVALPLAMIAEVPFTTLASRLVFEESDAVRARDVVRQALREIPRVFFARLAALVMVTIGIALFFVPGLWIASISLFLGEIMLLERSGFSVALGRSQRITDSSFSEVFLALLVLASVPLAGALLGDVAGRALASELFQFRPPTPVWASGGSALAIAGLFVQVPYRATARFFVYLDVRTRAEGWDIQTRFAALVREQGDR